MLHITSRVVGFLALSLSAASLLKAEQVLELPQRIPLAGDVDVVVLGDSSGAVEAACEAARRGLRVFLLAPRPYLGTDLCATLQLGLQDGEQPKSKLALACFGDKRSTTPLTVKVAMDKALLEAGVRYLTGCCATEVLRDARGRLAGIVMANRSGRQAVRAKVVIDATGEAAAARQAGAAFRPFVPGRKKFTRVVIGGDLLHGDNLSAQKLGFAVDVPGKRQKTSLPAYEYTVEVDVPAGDIASRFRAENLARDLTCVARSQIAAETLSQIPADTLVGEKRLESWPGAGLADLAAFRPKGMPRLYVLSVYADLDRRVAEKLQQPLVLMELGQRIGRAAAEEARAIPSPEGAVLPQTDVAEPVPGTVGESLDGIGGPGLGTLSAGRRALPVLNRYDVVVVGGGTSGAPAGIAAARRGAKTLVVEYLHELGGVGTAGLISSYWYGLRKGYTAYVDQHVNPGKDAWDPRAKSEWLRRELLRNGADVWLGTLACGALVCDGRVCGVVVAAPQGRGAVLASTVIDATGNADIAAWAGAQTQYSVSEKGALNVQIAGFPQRPLDKSYVNTCYTMVDDTDVVDVWHLMLWKRISLERTANFDVGQLIDSRERRRVVGDYTLTVADILAHRTFADTISQHYSNFDAAAFPDSPLLLLQDAKGPCFATDLPLRCLLPRGLDGLLVVGLGASAERDAMTLIRMQPDLQNQGYAAGVVAAAAAKIGGRTRCVDVRAIQKELVGQGILEQRVATDKDSLPTTEELERAARAVGEPGHDRLGRLAILLTHRQAAIPLLKTRYAQTAGQERLHYATILGMLGEPDGAAALIAAVDAHEGWDRGTALTTQRKTGNTFSDLDRLVIALGFGREPKGQASLLRKLAQLQPETEVSHYKALSLALWDNPPAAAAEPLARLLQQPGFAGHASLKAVSEAGAQEKSFARPVDRLVTVDPEKPANTTNLNRAYKELIVATLLYRCGDAGGVAQSILAQYSRDVHGHFARYARQILKDRPHLPAKK